MLYLGVDTVKKEKMKQPGGAGMVGLHAAAGCFQGEVRSQGGAGIKVRLLQEFFWADSSSCNA